MCGIVAYIGKDQASDIIVKGLQRLEYRGYDSAGIAILNDSGIQIGKKSGKVSELKQLLAENPLEGTLGIGHTRWATHGAPNDVNAHPHASSNERLALVHNGIIENYSSIRAKLEKEGLQFKSETDTEVLVQLIEFIRKEEGVELKEALRLALTQVVGAYALVLIDSENPEQLIVAKKGSPLVIGIGEDGTYYCASDATPIIEYTRNVIYLEEEEIGIINRTTGVQILGLCNNEKTPYLQELAMELEAIEKGGYDHFMLKEIFEQPKALKNCMRGRLQTTRGTISMGGIIEYKSKISKARRFIIVACGTSWHAGLVAEYLFEDLARIPVEVEYASEFRYRNPIITEDDVIIAISQSGETADTLAAIELAKSKGATIFGVCNVVGSSISRASHAGAYTHAGPEIGVASTKAFTAQVTLLTMMSLFLAKTRGTLPERRYNRLLHELESIPEKIERILEKAPEIEAISKVYKNASNALYLGRGYTFPVALEGALKLKEISYIHAEGYPAAEMKHGPIALIDEEMPVFVIATQGASYQKVVSNIQEVKARKGKVVAIVTEGDTEVKAIADHIISIPNGDDALIPLLSVIPLQLISYYIAVMRGCNVDQPRNLAKSVTVE